MNDPLPLLSVFIDNMRVGEAEIDGGSTEAVMTEDLLNGGQRDISSATPTDRSQLITSSNAF